MINSRFTCYVGFNNYGLWAKSYVCAYLHRGTCLTDHLPCRKCNPKSMNSWGWSPLGSVLAQRRTPQIRNTFVEWWGVG